MTVAESFEALSSVFNPAAAAGMTKTLQWNITGDEAGVWAFKIVNGVGELGVVRRDAIGDENGIAAHEIIRALEEQRLA